VRQGLVYVARSQWLWITILIAALSNVSFSAPYVAVLPRLVHDRYAGGPALYGTFLATDAVGFLIASLALSLLRMRRRGVLAYSVLLLSGLGLLVLGLPLPASSRVVIALGACLCAGFSIGVFSVVEVALMQELVPGDVQGRVNSLNRLGSYVLLPFGLLLVGWLADLVGPGWVFVVGGLISLLLAAAGLSVRSIRDLA
jgi:MFS family permease